MACNPTRLELSNTDATSVQVTISPDPGDGATVTLEVPGLSINESDTTSGAVATYSIAARTEPTNGLWDGTVQVGDGLGKIGLSGRTPFPHVHISVCHNGTRIDPFAPSGRLTCNSSTDTLWDTAIEYDAGGLLSLRFFDHLPKIETLRFGLETAPLKNQSPEIVIATF